MLQIHFTWLILFPIILALCLMLFVNYYAQNYAVIIGGSLLYMRHFTELNCGIIFKWWRDLMSPAWWFYKQAVVKCMVKGGKTSVTYDEYTTLTPQIRGRVCWVDLISRTPKCAIFCIITWRLLSVFIVEDKGFGMLFKLQLKALCICSQG